MASPVARRAGTGSAPDLESDVRPALRRTSSLPPVAAPPRRPSDPAALVAPSNLLADPPTQRRERSELPPPPRPTVRKSMPIPKAAIGGAPALASPRLAQPRPLSSFPGHDVVDEPLTARLDNTKRSKQDSIYGEETATSRRPMETYEKWLAENRAENGGLDEDDLSMDDIATESMEAVVPRKQAAPKTQRMPERVAMPPRRTEASVNVSIEEIDDEDGLFSDADTNAALTVPEDRPEPDHHGSDPIVESSVEPSFEPSVQSSDDDMDVDGDFDAGLDADTRNGLPKPPSAFASQPLPLMQAPGHAGSHAGSHAAPPRIATALGLGPAGFPPVQQMPQPMQQQSLAALPVHSGSQPIPLQSPQLQALRMQAMQQLQQMQAGQMQSAQMQSAPMQAGQMQSAQMQSAPMRSAQMQQPYTVLNGVSGASGPVITPGLNQAAPSARAGDSKIVHRAPWFCLGLMVGVAAMVAAFFMPAARESAAADTAKAPQQVVAPPPPQFAQQQQMAPQQTAPRQMVPSTPGQLQPQPSQPSQMVSPPQAAVTQGATGPAAAAQAKPMPTVDVRTLPIAGQKTSQAAPVRRAAPRPPARRAPAPKPLADDDDAPASAAPAPKPATPAPSDTVNPDTLLQAL